ncbi:MAG: efflux RND transporter periplasmic adaptor subunit [Sandaracinaceae bacterium]|nr:efflux RND transporter periplasmic adaptor subunit [Sandaracinaceae bacterium]
MPTAVGRRLTSTRSAWALLALALGGCSRGESAPHTARDAGPPLPVTTHVVTEAAVPRTLTVTGALRGERETQLAANANGLVLWVAGERGHRVRTGDVIARLDTRSAALSAAAARASAASAIAQAEQAAADCARNDALLASGAISRQAYDQARTACQASTLGVEAANVRARLASQAVRDGIIRAPFDALIVERFVEVGEYVGAASPVVSLSSQDTLRLEMAVPEAEIASVTEDARVTFEVAAHPGRRFEGRVAFIAPAVRDRTRDLVVEAIVAPDPALRPGMFAAVRLVSGERPLPVVPRSAVRENSEGARVFVIVDGRAEERMVALGETLDDRVAIERGLVAGEVIASAPGEALTNGRMVITTSEPRAAEER